MNSVSLWTVFYPNVKLAAMELSFLLLKKDRQQQNKFSLVNNRMVVFPKYKLLSLITQNNKEV
jgi:hypothetical protein